jgi:predicted small integral membrane protein
MYLKKILAALLTVIGTGGILIIYGVIAVFFFVGGIGHLFNAKNNF